MLAADLGLEHLRWYIYGKPIKMLSDHRASEPLTKQNRSNTTYSARLTRWLDRLAHAINNVNHISGKHLALTDYLSRTRSATANGHFYDEEYVINNSLPHHKFISKHGCLSNQVDQSESGTDESVRKTDKEPRSKDAREQPVIDCLNSVPTHLQLKTAHFKKRQI